MIDVMATPAMNVAATNTDVSLMMVLLVAPCARRPGGCDDGINCLGVLPSKPLLLLSSGPLERDGFARVVAFVSSVSSGLL